MTVIKKSTKSYKCWRECGEREPSYSVGVQPLWKRVWRFLRKLKIELPYEPAIRLLGIYLGKTIIQKKYMHPMFITPLFTTARTCVHQQMDGKEEVVYIYSGILLNLKKSNIM